jgi:2-methylcitrate dehydratase PrpD
VNATRGLAEFALNIRPGAVEATVKHETLRILLDCVGCAVAGRVTLAGQIAVDLVKGERGPMQATILGAGSASLMPVAFANTVLTNALDFEPVGPEGHVCAVAVPVALAVAEAIDASGDELLAGLLAGLEVGGRIGGATRRPSQGGAAGRPAVRGTAHAAFAAVAAAGRLLRLTADQMHHAFGIAGYSATVPTLRKMMSSPRAPMTKYDHLGLMAQNGIQAALLAQRGFTGDLEVLEGELGFWRFAGAEGCDWDLLTRDLGSYWTIPETWYKRYPAILYTGPGIELARQLVRENDVPLGAIEHLEVHTTRTNEVQMGKEVRDAMDAWTSYAYNVAAGLYDVWPRRSWHEPEAYGRPDILALANKVNVRPLAPGELSTSGNYWQGWCPLRVTLQAGGRTYEGARDELMKMDDAELVAKFRDNVGGLLDEGAVQRLEAACWSLGEMKSARELTGLLADD